jgi:hypothetical protein
LDGVEQMLKERCVVYHGVTNMERSVLLDAVIVENEVVKQDLELKLDFPLLGSSPILLYFFLAL